MCVDAYTSYLIYAHLSWLNNWKRAVACVYGLRLSSYNVVSVAGEGGGGVARAESRAELRSKLQYWERKHTNMHIEWRLLLWTPIFFKISRLNPELKHTSSISAGQSLIWSNIQKMVQREYTVP